MGERPTFELGPAHVDYLPFRPQETKQQET
jgi:hypothetical protein